MAAVKEEIDMKKTRYYNGKIYRMLYPDKNTSYPNPLSHQRAMSIAKDEREGLRLARVIRIKGGYGVFISHDIWWK